MAVRRFELVPITALLIGAPSLSAMISSPDPIGYLLTSHGESQRG